MLPLRATSDLFPLSPAIVAPFAILLIYPLKRPTKTGYFCEVTYTPPSGVVVQAFSDASIRQSWPPQSWCLSSCCSWVSKKHCLVSVVKSCAFCIPQLRQFCFPAACWNLPNFIVKPEFAFIWYRSKVYDCMLDSRGGQAEEPIFPA